MDCALTFTNHTKKVARNASFKLGCIRGEGDVLDARGDSSLYKAQVRPIMEYASLTWFSCPSSYLTRLSTSMGSSQNRKVREGQDTGPRIKCLPVTAAQKGRGRTLCVLVLVQHFLLVEEKVHCLYNRFSVESIEDKRVHVLPSAI